jgi:biopolymer transport protein ExbD
MAVATPPMTVTPSQLTAILRNIVGSYGPICDIRLAVDRDCRYARLWDVVAAIDSSGFDRVCLHGHQGKGVEILLDSQLWQKVDVVEFRIDHGEWNADGQPVTRSSLKRETVHVESSVALAVRIAATGETTIRDVMDAMCVLDDVGYRVFVMAEPVTVCGSPK